MMKPTDVARNISNAKAQIERLKGELEYLSAADESTVAGYAGVMHYSISKFQSAVGISKKEKSSNPSQLPQIQQPRSRSRISLRGNSQLDDSFIGAEPNKAYRRMKRQPAKNNQTYEGGDERTKSFSKAESQNISLSIAPRQMRILSFVDKHVKQEYQTDIKPMGIKLDFKQPPKSLDIKQFIAQPDPIQKEQERKLKLYNMYLTTERHQSDHISAYEPRPLPYDEAVDKYSLHHFMIRKGKIVSDTPEFSSFRRIYDSIWKRLKMLIQKIEELLTKHKIELAYVDGKRLAVLAIKPTFTVEDLVNCLVDHLSYAQKILPKSRFTGIQGKLKAILMIQRFWRMTMIRRQYVSFRTCVIKLQRFSKKFINRVRTLHKIHQKNEAIHQSFCKNQKALSQNWNKLKDQPRVEIHVNSLSLDEMKRLTVCRLSEKKNIEIMRIFRVKDPNVSVVMVCPNEVPPEVLNYYHKILQLSDIPNYRDRLYFVVPEATKHFPQHFSTSKLLYYSPKCMQKIKKIINGRPAYMISGYPCNDTIKICQQLNIHLLSGDPQKTKYFSTKSQARRLFMGSDIPVAPGAMELYDLAEFVNTLAVLIANNKTIKTWVIKIDDELSGRGIATLSISRIKGLRRLLGEHFDDETQSKEEFFQTVLPIEEQAQFHEQLTTKIKALLVPELPKKLHICTPRLYATYQQFMARMLVKGGCIEAYPDLFKEDIKSCSLSFFCNPSAEIQIVCTYEKLHSQPMIPMGCKFPQQSLPYNTVYKCCKSLSEALTLRGIFGFFTIDLLCFKEEKETNYRYWAIGLDCFLNSNTCSFYYFDALMNGKYFVEQDQYLIDERTEEVFEAGKEHTNITHSTDTISTIRPALQSRRYLFMPFVYHEQLTSVKMKTFFKMARLEGISYDIQGKKGICMVLVDQLSSGVLGVLVVGEQQEDIIDDSYKALMFISRQAKKPTLNYGTTELNARTDELQFRDVLSKINHERRRFGRKNFKQQAYKKNLINCNLEEV